MGVKQRILTCRLIEKMKEQGSYSKQLGLEDTSTFYGMHIIQKKKEEKTI